MKKNIFLCMVMLFLTNSMHAMFTVSVTDKVADSVDKLGYHLEQVTKNLGPALKDAAPVLGEQGQKMVQTFGEEIRKTVPNADANFANATNAIARAARTISNMRALPIVGIGLTGAITAVVMCAQGIKTLIMTDEKDTGKKKRARKLIGASLLGLCLSSWLIGNSSAILDFFSE